jgi:nitrogen PTS system EIIA component
MNLITQYLHSNHIVLDAPYTNKKRSFEAIAELFAALDGLSSDVVYQALISRERMESTALGYGVAIPHGRVKGLNNTVCAVMRLNQAIDFEAPDAIPVQLMVVLLVPEQAGQAHLDLLSELATLLSSRDFRNTLLNANSAAEMYRAFLTSQPNSGTALDTTDLD